MRISEQSAKINIREVRAAPTSDWLVASCAERAPLGVVVSLAVGQPLVVEERAAVERLPAVLQNTKNTCVRKIFPRYTLPHALGK
jgi:hypothetical protein